MENDQPPAVVFGASSESERYQADITRLRAAGCRCMLMWNVDRQQAVPVSMVEALDCPVSHGEDAKPCGLAT